MWLLTAAQMAGVRLRQWASVSGRLTSQPCRARSACARMCKRRRMGVHGAPLWCPVRLVPLTCCWGRGGCVLRRKVDIVRVALVPPPPLHAVHAGICSLAAHLT